MKNPKESCNILSGYLRAFHALQFSIYGKGLLIIDIKLPLTDNNLAQLCKLIIWLDLLGSSQSHKESPFKKKLRHKATAEEDLSLNNHKRLSTPMSSKVNAKH